MLRLDVSLKVSRGFHALAESRAFRGEGTHDHPMLGASLQEPWHAQRLLRSLDTCGDQVVLETFSVDLGLQDVQSWRESRARARLTGACLVDDESGQIKGPCEVGGHSVPELYTKPKGVIFQASDTYLYSAKFLQAWAPSKLPEGGRVAWRGALVPGWLALRWPQTQLMDPRCWMPVPGFRPGVATAGQLGTWISQEGVTLPEDIMEDPRAIDLGGGCIPLVRPELADRLARKLRKLLLVPILDPQDETAQVALELRQVLLTYVAKDALTSS